MKIEPSELIINSDGSIYHINLLPSEIADTILLVGDPGRVATVSSFFDSIEVKKQNREFYTHTGTYKGKRISVMSTGIGTDNLDIVINELDALVNIDLQKREIKDKLSSLTLIRLGTSGALQEDIPVHTFLMSETACGFDGLLNFYEKRNEVCHLDIEAAFKKHTDWNPLLTSPYFVDCCSSLSKKFTECTPGITISSPGFYGPQGRVLRLGLVDANINDKISDFSYNGRKITNYEMECSALYGLSKLLGHHALTICTIIANRRRNEFSKGYHDRVKEMIYMTLETIVAK
ncbi:MAG: phosphorylase [Bacteroidetes bacterium HGW-Bacteroidetes-21]|jgi:uridine phosphorylase|nr:MAG: phosphorylase [Bacteroidetes bacterium HGW-Bacteroidetes-21]